MKPFILLAVWFTVWTNFLYAQSTDTDTTKNKATIGLNSELSYKLLEPMEDLRKVRVLVDARESGLLKKNRLIIGASLIALADYQHSSVDSKFAYLMRHPTASNQIGQSVSEAAIHSFQLSFTGTATDWLAIHTEILYNPEQSFGTGTITSLERNQLQLRKGFIVVGNLSKFPVYGAIGKMDAPFGQMGSVNPFSNSTMWHAFGGLGYGAQVSFKKWGLHATFMAVQGGAQFRAMNMPVQDSTNIPSKLNNFVADLNYTLEIGELFSFMLGGSYLHGCAYCQEFPVIHFDPCPDNNPAVTGYATFRFKDKIIVKGSFASTLGVWAATHNPTAPLDIYEAVPVTSLDIGARYTFWSKKKWDLSASAEFSNFRAGADGSPWERQNQIMVGFAALFNKSSKFFLEVFRTEGYAPLNFISGSNAFQPFAPGTTHSVRNANSIGVVIGGQVTF